MKRGTWTVAVLALLGGVAGRAPAQGFAPLADGIQLCALQVPGLRGVAAVLALPVGAAHDPVHRGGMAEVGGEALRLLAAEQPGPALQVEVLWTTTLVSVVDATPDLAAALAPLSAVVARVASLDQDLAARAVWRTVLRADDRTEVYPGPLLRGRARRALVDGRRGEGDPAQLAPVDAAALRAWLTRQLGEGPAWLVVAAPVPAAVTEAVVVAALAGWRRRAGAAPAPLAVAPVPDLPATTPHPRVRAPFVSYALRQGDDQPAFRVAMEVLRARAVRALGDPRGGEARARLPPFHYAPEELPLAFVSRRAPDGGTAAEVCDEIDAVLAEALAAAGADDVARARALLQQRCAPPPWPRDGRDPRALFPRLRSLALAAPDGGLAPLRDRLGAVGLDRVRAALRRAVAGARAFALQPLAPAGAPRGR